MKTLRYLLLFAALLGYTAQSRALDIDSEDIEYDQTISVYNMASTYFFAKDHHDDLGLLDVDIDSIVFSRISPDGIRYENPVTQYVFCSDTIYSRPICDIDSITFRLPPTEFQPGVMVITEEWVGYITDIVNDTIKDERSIIFRGDTPHSMVPTEGQYFFCEFDQRLIGKALKVTYSTMGIVVTYTDRIGHANIYRKHYSVCEEIDQYMDDGSVRHISATTKPPLREDSFWDSFDTSVPLALFTKKGMTIKLESRNKLTLDAKKAKIELEYIVGGDLNISLLLNDKTDPDRGSTGGLYQLRVTIGPDAYVKTKFQVGVEPEIIPKKGTKEAKELSKSVGDKSSGTGIKPSYKLKLKGDAHWWVDFTLKPKLTLKFGFLWDDLFDDNWDWQGFHFTPPYPDKYGNKNKQGFAVEGPGKDWVGIGVGATIEAGLVFEFECRRTLFGKTLYAGAEAYLGADINWKYDLYDLITYEDDESPTAYADHVVSDENFNVKAGLTLNALVGIYNEGASSFWDLAKFGNKFEGGFKDGVEVSGESRDGWTILNLKDWTGLTYKSYYMPKYDRIVVEPMPIYADDNQYRVRARKTLRGFLTYIPYYKVYKKVKPWSWEVNGVTKTNCYLETGQMVEGKFVKAGDNEYLDNNISLEPFNEYGIFTAFWKPQIGSVTTPTYDYVHAHGTPTDIIVLPAIKVSELKQRTLSNGNFENYIEATFNRVKPNEGYHIGLLVIPSDELIGYDVPTSFEDILNTPGVYSKIKFHRISDSELTALGQQCTGKKFTYEFKPDMAPGQGYYYALVTYCGEGTSPSNIKNARKISLTPMKTVSTTGPGYNLKVKASASKNHMLIEATPSWNGEKSYDCKRKLVIKYRRKAIDDTWMVKTVPDPVNRATVIFEAEDLEDNHKYEYEVTITPVDPMMEWMSVTKTGEVTTLNTSTMRDHYVHTGTVKINEKTSTNLKRTADVTYSTSNSWWMPGTQLEVYILYTCEAKNEAEAKKMLTWENRHKKDNGIYFTSQPAKLNGIESTGTITTTRYLHSDKVYYFRAMTLYTDSQDPEMPKRIPGTQKVNLGNNRFGAIVYADEVVSASTKVSNPEKTQNLSIYAATGKSPFTPGSKAVRITFNKGQESAKDAITGVKLQFAQSSTATSLFNGQEINNVNYINAMKIKSSKAPARAQSRGDDDDLEIPDDEELSEYFIDIDALGLEDNEAYLYRPVYVDEFGDEVEGPLYSLTPDYEGGHDTQVVSERLEYIDLGLSVDWANMNVGARGEMGYGDYYSWGANTVCITCNEEDYTAENKPGGIAGNPDTDIVTKLYGSGYQIPTKEHWQELIDNCDWEFTQIGDVFGLRATSKINGKSVFFPAAGVKHNDAVYDNGTCGCYWSATQAQYELDSYGAVTVDPETDAYRMHFDPDDYVMIGKIIKPNLMGGRKYFGRSVRAVKTK